MSEIEILVVKLKDSEESDEFINTELTLKELKTAIHFFEERKRKNITGGRPKKVEVWVEKFLNLKHYFLFEELDIARKNREIGRDSYYRILRKLKQHGWNRKFLTQLYEFTLTLRKLVFIICNYKELKENRKILEQADKTFAK